MKIEITTYSRESKARVSTLQNKNPGCFLWLGIPFIGGSRSEKRKLGIYINEITARVYVYVRVFKKKQFVTHIVVCFENLNIRTELFA